MPKLMLRGGWGLSSRTGTAGAISSFSSFRLPQCARQRISGGITMKTILVADDEPSIRLLIRTTLENPDCRILEAATGAAALAVAKRLPLDVIILDWMMPGISGLDVLRALRNDPHTAQIPVIMVTAMGQEQHRAEGTALGAQAYLLKPFSPLELLQLTQQVLEAAAAEESHDESGEPKPCDLRRTA